MKTRLWLLLIALAVLAACAPRTVEMPKAELPAGKAWADGKEIYFIHTEASNADVAEKLTAMMQSPVIHVPSLANMPADSLANVYVFANGVEGSGPFGFQADVFDNPPGSQGYTPLRRLNVVSWTDESGARELTSAAEVLDAESAGEVTIDVTSEVINMPFVVWDGGQR